MKILIIGPQGSGKTTQAQIIAEKYRLAFLSLGNRMRELANEDSEEGRIVKERLDKGELVPDEIAAKSVQQFVKSEGVKNGFVADGYPRTINQISLYNPDYDKVFYLDVADEIVTKRLLQRGRFDDTAKLIKERLSWYHEEIEPLLDYYQKQGKLVKIDGSQGIDKVTAEIEEYLKAQT